MSGQIEELKTRIPMYVKKEFTNDPKRTDEQIESKIMTLVDIYLSMQNVLNYSKTGIPDNNTIRKLIRDAIFQWHKEHPAQQQASPKPSSKPVDNKPSSKPVDNKAKVTRSRKAKQLAYFLSENLDADRSVEDAKAIIARKFGTCLPNDDEISRILKLYKKYNDDDNNHDDLGFGELMAKVADYAPDFFAQTAGVMFYLRKIITLQMQIVRLALRDKNGENDEQIDSMQNRLMLKSLEAAVYGVLSKTAAAKMLPKRPTLFNKKNKPEATTLAVRGLADDETAVPRTRPRR